MKKLNLLWFLPLLLFATQSSGTYTKEYGGAWDYVWTSFEDSVKITNADTITYSGIVITGANLQSLFIKTDDDSVKVEYATGFSADFYTDWTELVSYPSGSKSYTFYLDYANYLKLRFIGLGVDSTAMKIGILIGTIR